MLATQHLKSNTASCNLQTLLETAWSMQHRQPDFVHAVHFQDNPPDVRIGKMAKTGYTLLKKLVATVSGSPPGSYPWCRRHPPATTVQVLTNLVSWHILHQFLLLL